MRKRPSIASVYLVRVSCPCIASVYRVRANIRDHTSVIFLLYIRHFLLHVRPLLHIRPILTGWKLLPQHPRASMSLVASLVASLVMSLVVSLEMSSVMSSVVSLVMSLVVWGGCDSMNILLERARRRFFTSVITCP